MPRANSKNTQVAQKRRSPILTVILLILVVALIAGLVYMFVQNKRLRSPDEQTKIQEENNQRIVDKVMQLILVPDEEPTLATIVNVDNLRKTNPDFYKDAVNGDQLVIYSSKAIIYRESDDIIINVAPVIIKPNEEEGLTEDPQEVPASSDEESVNATLEEVTPAEESL
jgi:hypothetical protein